MGKTKSRIFHLGKRLYASLDIHLKFISPCHEERPSFSREQQQRRELKGKGEEEIKKNVNYHTIPNQIDREHLEKLRRGANMNRDEMKTPDIYI